MNAPWTPVRPKVRPIIDDAVELLGISAIDIVSQRRRADVVRARFAVFWVARHATTLSFPQIAAAVGGRDHSTILHGVQRAEQMRRTDDEFRMVTDQMRRRAEERDPT